jgi:hypothetical protein
MHALFIIKVCACACVMQVNVIHSNQEQKQPSIQNTRDTISKISLNPQSDAETMASSSAHISTSILTDIHAHSRQLPIIKFAKQGEDTQRRSELPYHTSRQEHKDDATHVGAAATKNAGDASQLSG